MRNILQNATKVKDELKVIALGALVLAPLVGAVYSLSMLVDYGYLNKEILANIFAVIAAMALCWSVGGITHAIIKWRQYQQEQKELKTEKAFERISSGVKSTKEQIL